MMDGQKGYDENRLVEQIRSGDREAFGRLYDRFSPALYGIVCRITGDEELAQDVLQNAFVKIWKHFDSYRSDKGTLFTWMLNIARNTAIDASRSKHERNKIREGDRIVGMEQIPDAEMAVDHLGLRETIRTLKPEYQLIIDYLYIKGYTQEETARELNMPLGTVKTRIRSAIMQLRELLNVKTGGS